MSSATKIIIFFCAVSFCLGIVCPSCGERIDNDALFCPHCGDQIEWGYLRLETPRKDFEEIQSPTGYTLNGFPLSIEPPQIIRLLAGRHRIEYNCDGGVLGRDFGVIEGDTTVLLLECYKEKSSLKRSLLSFSVIPYNADVKVGDRVYSANDTIEFYGGSRVEVVFSKDGFAQRETTLTLVNNFLTEIDIRLVPVGELPVCDRPSIPAYSDTLRQGGLNPLGIGLMAMGIAMVSIPAFTSETEVESGKKSLETWQIGIMVGGIFSFGAGGIVLARNATGIDERQRAENKRLKKEYELQMLRYRDCLDRQENGIAQYPFEIRRIPIMD